MNETAATARCATVIGREHVRLGRNNQDGACVASRGRTTVAVVTDGCSSQPFSEVGARLGAKRLVDLVLGLEQVPLLSLPTVSLSLLTDWLTTLVQADLEELEAYGLFTVLCAVEREGETIVFGSGDGAYLIDGVVHRLDAGPDNAPAYLGYRLAGRDVPARVHFVGRAKRVAVMTDGLDGWLSRSPSALEPMLAEPLVWKNPAHLQRQLNVVSMRERFADDATIAVISGEGA